MSLFVDNSKSEGTTYKATIQSVLQMNLIVRFLSCGVPFLQASKLYTGFKEETGMGVLGSINDGQVAQICRVICAVNLQQLKDILKKYAPSQLVLMPVIMRVHHISILACVSF